MATIDTRTEEEIEIGGIVEGDDVNEEKSN